MTTKKSRPRLKGPEISAVLSVRIQPRASKNETVVMENGRLKIRLTAPPVDGAANEALVKYLAQALSVPKSDIEILTGHTSREKTVRISGKSDAEAIKALNTSNE